MPSLSSVSSDSRLNTGFRRVQAVEEALYRTWMRERRGKDHASWQRRDVAKECEIVAKTNHPSALRDGKFSFWKDIRPPFTVTGMGPLDMDDPQFKELVEAGEVDKLSFEVYKVEYEVYLNHNVEHGFGLVEDNRLFSTAIVSIPHSFPKRKVQVHIWGSHKTSSTFTKKLEFLFHPESKKTYSPTKGLDPDWALTAAAEEISNASTSAGASRASSQRPSPLDEYNPHHLSTSSSSPFFPEKSIADLKALGTPRTVIPPPTTYGPPLHAFSRPDAFHATSTSVYGLEGGRAASVDSGTRYTRGFNNSSYNGSWLASTMRKKEQSAIAPSPELTRKILSQTFLNVADPSHKTHHSERFELSTSRRENSMSRKLGHLRNAPRTFYKDPDLHHSKIMSVDDVPVYGHNLLQNVNFTGRRNW